jgi:hypothetical protein
MDMIDEDNSVNGVLTIELNSWDNYQSKVGKYKNYIWRGQREDLTLKSSFDRSPQWSKGQRKKKLRKHLENFKKEMKQSHPHMLPKNKDDMWALGQHYGLKTPLLDWTLSPFIAAYFAFEKIAGQNDSYRYVFALKKSLKRLKAKQKKGNTELSKAPFVDIKESLKHPIPRFLAQKGIFTKALNGDDIETNVKRWSKKIPNEVILVKFKIPTKDRDNCLGDLHLMGIDYESLLLDLRDVVDKCNSFLLGLPRIASRCSQ